VILEALICDTLASASRPTLYGNCILSHGPIASARHHIVEVDVSFSPTCGISTAAILGGLIPFINNLDLILPLGKVSISTFLDAQRAAHGETRGMGVVPAAHSRKMGRRICHEALATMG
jgi:hypothetical protein